MACIIEPLNYCYNQTIPGVFDNSLSMMQQNAKMAYKINEIIQCLNNMDCSGNVNILGGNSFFSSDLTLQNMGYFDTNTGNYNQGSVYANGKYSVYREITSTSGVFENFNLQNNEYIGKTNEFSGFHGNDITFFNGKYYVVNTKDNSGATNSRQITVLDDNFNYLENINIVPDGLGIVFLWGITSDTNNLYLFGSKGGENIENIVCIRYDITLSNYNILTINYPMILFSAHQSVQKVNDKIYMLVTFPNAILEFNVTDTTMNIGKIYTLPDYDTLGVQTLEFEGLSYDGSNLIINTNGELNNQNKQTFIGIYKIDFIGNSDRLKNYSTDNSYTLNYRQTLYINNTYDGLYEDGSPNFPFKDLSRAIAMANYQNNSCRLVISDGDNYTIGYQYRKSIVLENTSDHDVIISNPTVMNNSKILVYGNNTHGFIFNDYVYSDNSTNGFFYCVFNGKITMTNFSIGNFYACESDSSESQPVIYENGSIGMCGIDTFNQSATEYVRATTFSKVFTSTDIQKKYVSDTSSILNSTKKTVNLQNGSGITGTLQFNVFGDGRISFSGSLTGVMNTGQTIGTIDCPNTYYFTVYRENNPMVCYVENKLLKILSGGATQSSTAKFYGNAIYNTR